MRLPQCRARIEIDIIQIQDLLHTSRNIIPNYFDVPVQKFRIKRIWSSKFEVLYISFLNQYPSVAGPIGRAV